MVRVLNWVLRLLALYRIRASTWLPLGNVGSKPAANSDPESQC
jgi:hypothetical protein